MLTIYYGCFDETSRRNVVRAPFVFWNRYALFRNEDIIHEVFIVRKFLSLRQRMMMVEMIEMESLLSVLGPILFPAIISRIWSCWIYSQ